MNTRVQLDEYAASWGIDLPEQLRWSDLLPLLEKIVRAKGGYFVIKVDGERSSNRLSFALNIPFPIDVVVRKDTDDYEGGIMFILKELMDSKVVQD